MSKKEEKTNVRLTHIIIINDKKKKQDDNPLSRAIKPTGYDKIFFALFHISSGFGSII